MAQHAVFEVEGEEVEAVPGTLVFTHFDPMRDEPSFKALIGE